MKMEMIKMLRRGTILLLALSLASASAFYESNSAITSLTASNFDSLVFGSEHPWIIEFYAPWCGHCQRLVPEYEKAAENLKGLVKVGSVNCDEDSGKPICGRYQIQGFPTIKIFPAATGEPSKKSSQFTKQPKDYQGARTARSIADAGLAEIPNFTMKVIGGASSGKLKNIEEFLSTEGLPKALLFTTKSTTTPLYKALAVDFRNRMLFGEIRETEKDVSARFNVEKFPALLIFPKDSSEPVVYDGPLQHGKLLSFLQKYAVSAKSSKPQSQQDQEEKPKEEPAEIFDPVIKKIENQQQFEEECLKRPIGMCLLSFMALEPEFEESVAEHQAQLKVLQAVKKMTHEKKMPFRVLWLDGLKERKLMNTFNLSDQLPSLMVLSPSKKVYRPFTAGFEEKAIMEFLEETSKAKGRHFKFETMPAMEN